MRNEGGNFASKLCSQRCNGLCITIEAFASTTFGSHVENSPPPDQLYSKLIFIPRLEQKANNNKSKGGPPLFEER